MYKFFGIAILLFLFGHQCSAQEKNEIKNKSESTTDTLPYQKYPTLPAFNIMLPDSATIFNTYNIPEGKPIVMLFFDPDCKHCRAEIKLLLSGMDSLKDIRFYFITSVHDFNKIRTFIKDHNLGDYKNIEVIGRDYEFFFMGYYGIKFVPDLVIYDQHKNLVKFFDGHVTVDELYKLTHKSP